MIKNLLLLNIPKAGISFLFLSLIIFPSFLKAQQQVIWTDLVGVILEADNTLKKTASYGSDNGGAASEQILPAGVDGWVEVTVLENNKMRYLGLSDVNSGISPSTIDYSIQFGSNDGHVNAYENGVRIGYAGFTANYEPGEVFRIERIGTTIYYKRSGNVFYTSTVPSSTAMVVDVCILDIGATIHNARISFGGVAPVAPETPGGLIIGTVSSEQIDLSWSDNSGNETGFEIERSLSPTNGYSVIDTVAADQVSYADTGLAANTTYYYRVRAINAAGASAYTQEVSATTSSQGGGGGTGEGSQVTWIDLVGVTIETNNTLTKTASYGAENSGAASEEVLPAGVDGWVEMSILENDKTRYLGLSDVNSGISPSTIDYSIQFSGADHHANAYENGNRIGYAGFTANYQAGEVFRIERVGTTVYYKRNGEVFYTSTVPSTGALVADVCLLHTGATIHDARISFGDAAPEISEAPNALVLEAVSFNQIDLSWIDNSDNETGFEIERSLTSANGYSLVHTTASDVISYSDAGLAPNTTYYYRVRAISATGTSAYTQELSVSTSPSGGGGTGAGSQVTWVDMVGVSLDVDNTLTKTAAYGSDNGGAASEQILPAGVDGWVEMTILENDKSRYIGLSDVNSGISPSTIDYSIQFGSSDHHANAYENGNRIGYAGFTANYQAGEVFRIERVGTTIYYKRNGNVFYTSTVPSTTALVVDVCILNTGATIHNARVSFGSPITNKPLQSQPPANLVQNRPSD